MSLSLMQDDGRRGGECVISIFYLHRITSFPLRCHTYIYSTKTSWPILTFLYITIMTIHVHVQFTEHIINVFNKFNSRNMFGRCVRTCSSRRVHQNTFNMFSTCSIVSALFERFLQMIL